MVKPLGRAGACVAAVALGGLLAGCGQAPRPAPLVAAPQPMTITIESGETLSGIAQAHHVPMRALAEANHLSPPYLIRAGGVLVIPAAGPIPPAAEPSLAVRPTTSVTVTAAAIPSTTSAAVATAPPPGPTAPAAPAPMRPPPQTVRSAALTPAGPAEAPQQPAEAIPSPPPPTATRSKPAELSGGATLPTDRGGTFLWPVRGRVVEGFGAGPDGTHNDGINIAAPRGAPVQAADGGVVAYTGNELRGYGNLILIKHPDGWISAYAHCDLILVKRGQKVSRGQVIARVGTTGNVSTPQLHFELRRGDKPVDPRGHLAPLPSAAAVAGNSG